MNFLGKLGAIVWKDLTTEFRSKEMLLSMSLFAFLVLIIFGFAFETGFRKMEDLIPGILWVAFIFSALMGLSRSFGAEREAGTLPGLRLCPVSPWGIYLAKMIGTFIFTAIMEVFALILLGVLYNMNLLPFLFPLGLIIFLGTLGFCSIGTIFSAMASTTKAKDVMLSILVFPISVPLIIASVKATGTILDGKSFEAIGAWIKILVPFDLVFLLLAYLTFEFIMEE